MKRFMVLLATLTLLMWLGCDKAQNPISSQNSNRNGDEADLKEILADSVRERSGMSAKQNVGDQLTAEAIRVPDDYATIQAAVDAANPGSKIIVKGSGSPYNEVVSATRPDIEITAQGLVTLNGYFNIGADNIKISHFNINILMPPGSSLVGGISVGAVSGVRIRHNTITGNSSGIFLNASTGCLVEMNTCTGLPQTGIILYDHANGNTITKNTCTGNGEGIHLSFSDNNVVNGNDCSANDTRGIDIGGSNGNRFKNNVCNRNATSGIVVNSGSDNVFGPGNTSNSHLLYGILFGNNTSNNTVKKNDFHCNTAGDILDLGTGNTFIKNSTGPLPGGCQ